MHQHFQLADVADLDGPIRTIPAPNLSGANGNFAYPTSKPLTYQQPVKSSYVGNSIGSSVSLPQPPTSAALYQHAIPTRSPAVSLVIFSNQLEKLIIYIFIGAPISCDRRTIE